jgi:hypothetical protein
MPITVLLTLITGYTTTARRALHHRLTTGTENRGWAAETGATTLELVIIVLGLIALATALVVALTTAVQRRTNQIN